MIEIDEAIAQIQSKCKLIGTELRSTLDSLGYVLAEDIVADVDSPPHDKSIVDGFAIRQADAGNTLHLIEQVVAGQVPTKRIELGMTSHIMTGAPIPSGTEAMVMVEDVEQLGTKIRVPSEVKVGQFIMPKARTFRSGDIVLAAGTIVRPVEVGLLCEVGRSKVKCIGRPNIAVLPTGDELVSCDVRPAVGQIRNSNGPMLEARSTAAGCEVMSLGVGRDNEVELREKIKRGLKADIFILSGGVSAGVRDLIPPTLSSLEVKEVFHKVNLKPGKPVWFGVHELDGHSTLVFGLPGNPISSLVCFELFVQCAIRLVSGKPNDSEMLPVRLAESFQQRGSRPTFYPGTLSCEEGRTFARPLAWHGSADMLTVARADCLIYFCAGEREYQVGEKLMALRLE